MGSYGTLFDKQEAQAGNTDTFKQAQNRQQHVPFRTLVCL
eukprot:g59443.t1